MVVTPRWVWVGIAGGLTAAASFYGTVRFVRDGPIYFSYFDLRWLFIPGTVAVPVVTHLANGSRGRLGRSFLVSAGVMTAGAIIPHWITLLTPAVQVVTST